MSLLAVIAIPYCCFDGSWKAFAAASSSSHVVGGFSPFCSKRSLRYTSSCTLGSTGTAYCVPWNAPDATVVGTKSARSRLFIRSLSGRRNSESGAIHGSSMNRTSYRPPVLSDRSCFL